MSRELDGARILVTGASGRIGTVAVPHLRALGARVTTLSVQENPELEADRVLIGDTTSQADVAGAIKGADLVVHLAALAHRDIAPPYDVYSTNVVSTFNVLQQAGEAGIGRAVVAGSINAYGLPMNRHEVVPAYFPIDTDIPVDISDWYSLSKHHGESNARMAWRQWGIDVVTLRFPHVHGEEALRAHAATYRDDPASGLREAWSYLTTEDAARAIALSLTADTTGAHAFFLAANDTLAPYRTEDLLEAYAPGAPRFRRFTGRQVPIDLTPARRLIGFEARHEVALPTLDLPS